MKLEDLTTLDQLEDFLTDAHFRPQQQGCLLPLDSGGTGKFRRLVREKGW